MQQCNCVHCLLEMREKMEKRKAGIGKRVEKRASISMLSTTTTLRLLLLLQLPLLLMLLPFFRQSPAFQLFGSGIQKGRGGDGILPG